MTEFFLIYKIQRNSVIPFASHLQMPKNLVGTNSFYVCLPQPLERLDDIDNERLSSQYSFTLSQKA